MQMLVDRKPERKSSACKETSPEIMLAIRTYHCAEQQQLARRSPDSRNSHFSLKRCCLCSDKDVLLTSTDTSQQKPFL